MDDLSPLQRARLPHGGPVSPELQHEVEQFLYLEAALLDEWRFRDWLQLIGEDISYVMNTNTIAQTRDRKKGVHPPTTYIFNEDKYQLERRIARLETGMAWAEEPPSRTRHFVTNVRILAHSDDEIHLSCNYLLQRVAKARDAYTYIGTRRDRLRREEGSFVIFERQLELDQFTLETPSLSILF